MTRFDICIEITTILSISGRHWQQSDHIHRCAEVRRGSVPSAARVHHRHRYRGRFSPHSPRRSHHHVLLQVQEKQHHCEEDADSDGQPRVQGG